MPQVALIAKFKVKDGKGEELVALFRQLLEHAEKEPGCLTFVLYRAADDPSVFWSSEVYADQEAFTVHRNSPALAAAMPVMGQLFAESEILVGEPLLGKGLPG